MTFDQWQTALESLVSNDILDQVFDATLWKLYELGYTPEQAIKQLEALEQDPAYIFPSASKCRGKKGGKKCGKKK